jgi:DNA polymerase elongation subunit (family B)
MGESTTGTGRAILKHQCSKVNELLTGTYVLNGDAIIYGDTDSTYFKTFAETQKESVVVADHVGNLVNDSFQEFMQRTFLCNPGFDNIIKCGREIVSDRGIFVEKKRYILHVVDNEGDTVDKLKVMGLDTKKTTLPRDLSAKLNKYVERLLKGEEWKILAEELVDFKQHLKTTDNVMSIGLPKGIKGVEEYTRDFEFDSTTRLPGHVAAAILYNKCLDQFEDNRSPTIVSGMKIKVFYLTQKVGRFKSIAIPVDIEQVPSWFYDNFSIDRDAHIERLVDNPLNNIFRAIGKKVPSKQDLVVDDLLGF